MVVSFTETPTLSVLSDSCASSSAAACTSLASAGTSVATAGTMLETEPELQLNVREFIELTVERSQKAIQMTMIEGFEQLNSKVLHIQEEFSKVKKYLKGGSSGSMFQVSSSTKLPALPVKSLEELNNLEEVLEDEEEKQCLIIKLSMFGGSHMRSVINNTMNQVLTRELANQFSLHGKKNKRIFTKLKLFECIVGELFM